jgi:hypothetical protein
MSNNELQREIWNTSENENPSNATGTTKTFLESTTGFHQTTLLKKFGYQRKQKVTNIEEEIHVQSYHKLETSFETSGMR